MRSAADAVAPGIESRAAIERTDTPSGPFLLGTWTYILFVGAHRSWRAPHLGMPAHRSAFLGTTPPQEAPAGRGPVAPALATPASTGTSVMWSSRFARDLQAQQARVGESKSAFQSKAAASYRDEDLPAASPAVALAAAGPASSAAKSPFWCSAFAAAGRSSPAPLHPAMHTVAAGGMLRLDVSRLLPPKGALQGAVPGSGPGVPGVSQLRGQLGAKLAQRAQQQQSATPAPSAGIEQREKLSAKLEQRKRKQEAREQEREQLRTEKQEKQRELQEQRAQHREEQQREREEQKRQKLEARAAEPKYPTSDDRVLIADGPLAGNPHTVLPPPPGRPTRACMAVGTDLEGEALAVVNFLVTFGSALVGMHLSPQAVPTFLGELGADGLTEVEEELLFRLTSVAVHARSRRRSACEPKVACVEGAHFLVLSEQAPDPSRLSSLVLSERQDFVAAVNAPAAAAWGRWNEATHSIWSLLTPTTWPLLLKALLLEPPPPWHNASETGQTAGGGAEAECSWREALGRVLCAGEASEIKVAARLKVKALHFLCEEASASSDMHALVDERLEKQAALRKQRQEQVEVERKRKAQLQAVLLEKRHLRACAPETDASTAVDAAVCAPTAAGDHGALAGGDAAATEQGRLAKEEEQAQHELLAFEQERVQREEAFSRALENECIRMEPLGMDRHEREYHCLPGRPGEIIAMRRARHPTMQAEAETEAGCSAAVSYASAEEVEALLKWLNDKSLAEQPLRQKLCLHLLAVRRAEQRVAGGGQMKAAVLGETKEQTKEQGESRSSVESLHNGGEQCEEDTIAASTVESDATEASGAAAQERANDRYCDAVAEERHFEPDASIVIDSWDEVKCRGHKGVGEQEHGVSERMPPFLQGVCHLTQRFSVCDGMLWGKEGLEIVKAHLLALEAMCRWCYLADWGGGAGAEERGNDAWTRIDRLVRGWVDKKAAWRQSVSSAECVSSLSRHVLALVELLESLAPPAADTVMAPAEARTAAAAPGRSLGDDCEGEASAALPAFWTSAALADTWYALLRCGGGVEQATVASVALAVLILGDRVGTYLRMLLALRFGMLGVRIRVMCWTQDVGRDEWHACLISHVRVPRLARTPTCTPTTTTDGHAHTAQPPPSTPASPPATRGSGERRNGTDDGCSAEAEQASTQTEAASACLLHIQHRVVWDEDEVRVLL